MSIIAYLCTNYYSMEREISWLPTSVKEVEEKGWESIDVIIFSADAYVDHPAFGVAIIARELESIGLKVAVVPQPNWQDDLRDFKKLGKPNLFFAVSAGSMDSMVNHYTAARRKRHDDAYTPEGRAGARPDMPTIVYTEILKKLYPEVPVVAGGIEASLRRITHYDYWLDKLMPSILFTSGADMLVYGMGEKPMKEISLLLKKGVPFESLTNIPQTAILRDKNTKYATNKNWKTQVLYSHEECLKDKIKHAKNFRIVEQESNSINAAKILQDVGNKTLIVNPQYKPFTTSELDAIYALPYNRQPHPRYKGKTIPAYNMIRHSVTLHRGCFGGCAFCTISAHQGKFVASRSEKSILDEVKAITEMPDFHGTITDLGGPSANMYKMQGKDLKVCEKCKRASCLSPNICKILDTNHSPLLSLYKKVSKMDGVKHCFIGSGIRYDLVLHNTGIAKVDKINSEYLENVIRYHVSGRFKVAPEHSSDKVLHVMRKPSFSLFKTLDKKFVEINKKFNLKQQLIPYFISSHPGSESEDMADLAVQTKDLNFKLEQVQDFTPTPMTVSTTIYYSGYHPYSLRPIRTAKTDADKRNENMFFFWYKSEFKSKIKKELLKINRPDLLERLYGKSGRDKINNTLKKKSVKYGLEKRSFVSKKFRGNKR